MFKKLSIIAVVGALFNLGCGGGGSSSSDDDPIVTLPPQTFSFQVFNENECGMQTPISGAEFLIYDESPRTNPNATFTTAQSNMNGVVELDIPAGESVSFTINYTEEGGNIRSYSFVDLTSGVYNMALAFEQDGLCNCEEIEMNAIVEPSLFSGEITASKLEGGDNLFGGRRSYDSFAINFSEVELCNDDFSRQPVIATAEVSGFPDRVVYDVLSNPTRESLSDVMILSRSAFKVFKPSLGVPYELDQELIYNNQNYQLSDRSREEDLTYAQFEIETPDAFQFYLRSFIDGSFNDIDGTSNQVSIRKTRYVRQNSSDASTVGTFANGSRFDVNYDTESAMVNWTTDSTENYGLTLFARLMSTADGNILVHYVYSPQTGSVSVPRNTQEMESIIANSSPWINYLGLLAPDTPMSSTEFLEKRRFGDQNGIRITTNERGIFAYYFPVNPTSSLKAKSKREIEKMLAADKEIKF